ncbi:flavin reductase family protein [Pantoea sp.]|uniref:flavin reductase family protein n=1 Tax=Pantoea sp. TaxID=69393 RepID=UPI002896DF0E|nr:flavin reductase family protein [Pantoea sp.]
MSSSVKELPLSARDAFLHATESCVAGVNIVATAGPGGSAAVTANAMISVSGEPPLMMISLRRDSPICTAIEENRRFSINVLSEVQKPLALRFAMPQVDSDPFDDDWTHESPASPQLKRAVASFDCQLQNRFVLNNHVVLVGEVQTIHRHPGIPLARQARQFVLIQRDQP